MSNCNSNPTSGCTENLLAIQLKIKKNEADPLFVDIEGVLDDILAKLVSCCAETGTNLDSMYEKLAQVLAINTECCEGINEKLELIAQELCILSENIEPCDETPTTEEPSVDTSTEEEFSSTTSQEEASSTTSEEEGSTTTSGEPATTTTTTLAYEDISHCWVMKIPNENVPTFPNNQLWAYIQITGQPNEWVHVMITPPDFVEAGYTHGCVCSLMGVMVGWNDSVVTPPIATEDPSAYGIALTDSGAECDEAVDCGFCWDLIATTTSSEEPSTTSTTTEFPT